MSNQQDSGSWRLVLDDGEGMEVRTAAASEEPALVMLRLPARRAYDLSRALDAHSRMAAILQESSEVTTEEGLARALADAAALAIGRDNTPASPTKIGDGPRLKAMSLLQSVRPEVSHSTAVAVIDAVAWWLDNNKDYMARDLLDAVATEEFGTSLYLTLIGLDLLRRVPPAGDDMPAGHGQESQERDNGPDGGERR